MGPFCTKVGRGRQKKTEEVQNFLISSLLPLGECLLHGGLTPSLFQIELEWVLDTISQHFMPLCQERHWHTAVSFPLR
jgi:hypothetical protein